jgi:hypothetical protein
MSNIKSINLEDASSLIRQIQRFQEVVGSDWKSVVNQWRNLQDCWRDRQYDRFEPIFEQLCSTYELCERQCEEYTEFLESRIRDSEEATNID